MTQKPRKSLLSYYDRLLQLLIASHVRFVSFLCWTTKRKTSDKVGTKLHRIKNILRQDIRLKMQQLSHLNKKHALH